MKIEWKASWHYVNVSKVSLYQFLFLKLSSKFYMQISPWFMELIFEIGSTPSSHYVSISDSQNIEYHSLYIYI